MLYFVPRFLNILEVLVFKLSSISLMAEYFIVKWIFLTRSPYLRKKVKHPENLDKYVVVQACNFYDLPLFPLKAMTHPPQSNSALLRADSALRCFHILGSPAWRLQGLYWGQRLWFKPCSVPALPGSVLSACCRAVMMHQCCPEQSCTAPCSESPAPAFWHTRQCWALPLCWDCQPRGVFLLRKGNWDLQRVCKSLLAPWEHQLCTEAGGSWVCSAIGIHSLCIFSFSCQIIDQSTGLNMHVRRKHSDNFSLIVLQPVNALRHNCQFH